MSHSRNIFCHILKKINTQCTESLRRLLCDHHERGCGMIVIPLMDKLIKLSYPQHVPLSVCVRLCRWYHTAHQRLKGTCDLCAGNQGLRKKRQFTPLPVSRKKRRAVCEGVCVCVRGCVCVRVSQYFWLRSVVVLVDLPPFYSCLETLCLPLPSLFTARYPISCIFICCFACCLTSFLCWVSRLRWQHWHGFKESLESCCHFPSITDSWSQHLFKNLSLFHSFIHSVNIHQYVINCYTHSLATLNMLSHRRV